MAAKCSKIFMTVAFAMVIIVCGCSQLGSQDGQKISEEMRALLDSDKIYENISVNGIHVGGLTKEEAVKKISDELYAPLSAQKVVLEKGNEKKWVLDLETLGYTYSVERGVQAAYDYARIGEDAERIQEIEELEQGLYNIPLYLAYNKGKVGEFLKEITDEISIKSVEPVFSRRDGELVGEEGNPGSALDYDQTLHDVLALTDNMHGGMLQLTLSEVQPQFTLEQIRNAHKLIGSFSTPITGSEQRDVNVKVAAGFINGVTLYPQAVFSTNETIGPTTYERGYREAPVIVAGKLEDGIGGGVCQVSSTLYNAVLFAELEVVQRRNHSLVVGYCPIGRDATLAGEVIDFRFRNTTDYPIYIESFTQGATLYVNIYGDETRPENRTLEFESVNMGHVSPPAAKETADATIAKGNRITTLPAITGQIVDVYKKVLIDGAVTERIYVDRSTYSARAAEVRVGTGAEAKQESTQSKPEAAPSDIQQPTGADQKIPEITEQPAAVDAADSGESSEAVPPEASEVDAHEPVTDTTAAPAAEEPVIPASDPQPAPTPETTAPPMPASETPPAAPAVEPVVEPAAEPSAEPAPVDVPNDAQ